MDEIERRIRAAQPVSRSRTLPLSDRAKRELADLLLSETKGDEPAFAGRVKGRASSRLMAMAAAVILALTTGLLWPHASAPASAITPQMLRIQPITSNTDLLLALSDTAAQQPTPIATAGEAVITVHTWGLNIEVDEAGTGPAVISPQVHTTTIHSDGSVSKVWRAGTAYTPSGAAVPDQEPAPGTVLGELDQSAAEYEPLFLEAAPREVALVEDFLRNGSGLEVAHASNALLAISYLKQEQHLDGLQTAALIAFLSGLADVTIEGITNDRLGREALVLSAPREDGQYTDRLLLDRSDGHVLAFESVYIGSLRTDLTAPAVTEYHLWENRK